MPQDYSLLHRDMPGAVAATTPKGPESIAGVVTSADAASFTIPWINYTGSLDAFDRADFRVTNGSPQQINLAAGIVRIKPRSGGRTVFSLAAKNAADNDTYKVRVRRLIQSDHDPNAFSDEVIGTFTFTVGTKVGVDGSLLDSSVRHAKLVTNLDDDRRGGYAGAWQIISPAAADGGRVSVIIDEFSDAFLEFQIQRTSGTGSAIILTRFMTAL